MIDATGVVIALIAAVVLWCTGVIGGKRTPRRGGR